MRRAVTDPDVQILASLSAAVEADYLRPDDHPWVGSPFEWILACPSRQKGAIGEQLVAGWCAAKGLDVIRSKNSDADRIIEGHRTEIKFSTLWTSGVYKFQQIRDQQYDHLFCLGLSPFDAHAWVIPKPVLLQHVIGKLGQHTGATGADTAWLSLRGDAPVAWMKPYGGRLSDAFQVLVSLGRGANG
jgi:hypothetical protein